MDGIKCNEKWAVVSEIKEYCGLANDGDLMEVTEWTSGFGFDVCVERKQYYEKFSLSYGEFELLKVLVDWKGE